MTAQPTAEERAETLQLARQIIADCAADPDGTGPTGELTDCVLPFAQLIVALADERDRAVTLADAACGLFDRADKCSDRPWMGCPMDHSTIESALYDEVHVYRAAALATHDTEQP